LDYHKRSFIIRLLRTEDMDWLRVRREGKPCTKVVYPYDIKLKYTTFGYMYDSYFYYEKNQRIFSVLCIHVEDKELKI